jgi:aryl-alcohol dehydrogenase-like predicted oxidoreductase
MLDIDEIPAESVQLGLTGLYVSPLGLGTWAWGDRLIWQYGKGYGEEDLAGAFRAALAEGVNFVDTAEVYGQGRSERFLGQFVKRTQRRLVSIATKFAPLPNRVRPGSVPAALRRSLERLQTDRVDLYQIHWPWSLVGVETWVSGLADTFDQGLTQAVGVSNYGLVATRRANAVLAARGIPLASNQVRYSLLDRKIERNGVLAFCQDQSITVIAYSPLAQGLLTGKYSVENPPPGMRRRQFSRKYLARIAPLMAVLHEIAGAHGKTPAQVALNWVICKGTLPIPGAKTAKQAADNAGALGWRLDSGEVAALDEASALAIA